MSRAFAVYDDRLWANECSPIYVYSRLSTSLSRRWNLFFFRRRECRTQQYFVPEMRILNAHPSRWQHIQRESMTLQQCIRWINYYLVFLWHIKNRRTINNKRGDDNWQNNCIIANCVHCMVGHVYIDACIFQLTGRTACAGWIAFLCMNSQSAGTMNAINL